MEGSAAPSRGVGPEVYHHFAGYPSFCFTWPEHMVTKAITVTLRNLTKNIANRFCSHGEKEEPKVPIKLVAECALHVADCKAKLLAPR